MGSLQQDLNRMNPIAHKHRFGDLFVSQLGALLTRGNYWFVDAAYGNDADSGQDLNHPVQTQQQALYNVANQRTASGKTYDDYLFLMPTNGVDYDDDTVGNTAKGGLANAYVYINIPNVHIVGVGLPNEVVINPGAAATAGVYNIGANGKRVSFSNITIKTATAQSAAIKTAAASDFLLVERCIFDLVGAAGPLGVGIDGDAGKISYPIIRDSTFWLGTLLLAGVILKVQDATPYGGLIDNCKFISVLNGAGTGCVDVINVKDGTGLIISNVYIHGGDTGTAYNADDGVDIDSGVLNTLLVNCNISGCDALITDGGTDTDIVNSKTADGEGSEYANAEEVLPAGLS